MSGIRTTALCAAILLGGCVAGNAGTLVYTPTNPTFGGSPLNGGTLAAEASAQNHGAHASSTGSSSLSTGQMFANQLTSQMYASLANQITQAIFGANAQQSGSYTFGGTTVAFNHVGGQIQITINDGATITTLSVPASS
jgi:curli production assembly/transport component CsgF